MPTSTISCAGDKSKLCAHNRECGLRSSSVDENSYWEVHISVRSAGQPQCHTKPPQEEPKKISGSVELRLRALTAHNTPSL